MSENENSHQFDIPDARESGDEPQRHFEADNIPKGTSKRSRKRGSFSSNFTPRSEPAPRENAGEKKSGDPPPRPSTAAPAVPRLPIDVPFEKLRLLLLLLVMVPLSVFAFKTPLGQIVYSWWYKLDYSHGFFVLPLVALFLYMRLDTYPGTRYRLTWIGLVPILICCCMRYTAVWTAQEATDQLSLFFWILGVVWFFYGTRVFLWALPSLGFLIFMFQLPWSFEMIMRTRLQEFAAHFAAILLQLIGETAIPIKNTIRLSTTELGVEAACSGIRFLISIFAIAFAAILLLRRPWWQNLIVLAIVVPLALFTNAARIAITGILLLHFEGFLDMFTTVARRAILADQIAGITMIFVALIIFFTFIWYLGKVFRRVEI